MNQAMLEYQYYCFVINKKKAEDIYTNFRRNTIIKAVELYRHIGKSSWFEISKKDVGDKSSSITKRDVHLTFGLLHYTKYLHYKHHWIEFTVYNRIIFSSNN